MDVIGGGCQAAAGHPLAEGLVSILFLVSFVTRQLPSSSSSSSSNKASVVLVDEVACGRFDLRRKVLDGLFRARIDHRPRHPQPNFCSGRCNDDAMVSAAGGVYPGLPAALAGVEAFIDGGLADGAQDPAVTPFFALERSRLRDSLHSHLLQSAGWTKEKLKSTPMFERLDKGKEHGRFFEVRKDLYAHFFARSSVPASAETAFNDLAARTGMASAEMRWCHGGGGGPCSVSDVRALAALCRRADVRAATSDFKRSSSSWSLASSIPSTFQAFRYRFESRNSSTRSLSGSAAAASQMRRLMPSPRPRRRRPAASSSSLPHLTAAKSYVKPPAEVEPRYVVMPVVPGDVDSGDPKNLEVSYPAGKGLVVVLQFCDEPMFGADLRNVDKAFADILKKFKGQAEVATFRAITKAGLSEVHAEVLELLESEERSFLAAFVLGHGANVSGRLHVQTHDDQLVDLEDNVLSRYDNENCPRLAGRPRFFLCQMCGGERANTAVRRSGASNKAQNHEYVNVPRSPVMFDPKVADFAVMMASVADTISVGHDVDGSHVTAEFCRVLRKYPTCEVQSIFKEVRRRLERIGYVNVSNRSENIAVVPEIRHTLSKDFAFFHRTA